MTSAEFFAYRDARKDQTRCANRIWSFCCRHGLDVDRRITEGRCKELLDENRRPRLAPPFRRSSQGPGAKVSKFCQKAIECADFTDSDMTRLQHVPGQYHDSAPPSVEEIGICFSRRAMLA